VVDKKSHPVSGLKGAEFSIFEDGVPQQIIAFSRAYDVSLETPNQPSGRGGATAKALAAPVESVGQASPTRTYLVCVDTLHSSFADLAQVRHALIKFFQTEQDAKAQYALINLGRHIEVIQDSTRDPSLVLSALTGKNFQRSVADSESRSKAKIFGFTQKPGIGRQPNRSRSPELADVRILARQSPQ
jgi:VWFA-related protein